MVTQDLINLWFTLFPVDPTHVPKYDAVRAAGLAFAEVLLAQTNPGADQDEAFQKLREAIDFANHSIAFNGQS